MQLQFGGRPVTGEMAGGLYVFAGGKSLLATAVFSEVLDIYYVV